MHSPTHPYHSHTPLTPAPLTPAHSHLHHHTCTTHTDTTHTHTTHTHTAHPHHSHLHHSNPHHSHLHHSTDGEFLRLMQVGTDLTKVKKKGYPRVYRLDDDLLGITWNSRSKRSTKARSKCHSCITPHGMRGDGELGKGGRGKGVVCVHIASHPGHVAPLGMRREGDWKGEEEGRGYLS